MISNRVYKYEELRRVPMTRGSSYRLYNFIARLHDNAKWQNQT